MNVLVTGFEPFGGESVNPSALLLENLPSRVAGHPVHTQLLPTAFGHSLEVLCAALERLKPEVTLLTGEAGGRAYISAEQVAINLQDARIPDNSGFQPQDQEIEVGGPDGLFSTLPVQQVVTRLRSAGIPAQRSLSAGAFVCNYCFYGLMRRLPTAAPTGIGGFVHLPYLPEQAARHLGSPSMAADLQSRAIRLALEVCLEQIELRGSKAARPD